MSKLKEKIRQDKAAGITIMGIFAILLIFLLAGFMIDFAKTVWVRGAYQAYAQKAAHVGVKYQNFAGGLSAESADKIVQEYMIQRHPEIDPVGATGEHNVMRSLCEMRGNYPKITITYDTERRRDVGTDAVSYLSTSGHLLNLPENQFNHAYYKVVQVEIEDVVDNNFWSIFGRPCQVIKVRGSAISSSAYDDED